jgi:hypothetical protein
MRVAEIVCIAARGHREVMGIGIMVTFKSLGRFMHRDILYIRVAEAAIDGFAAIV